MTNPLALVPANAVTDLAWCGARTVASGVCSAINFMANAEPSHALALVGSSGRALMPYVVGVAASGLRSMLMTVVNAESSTALILPSETDARRESTQVGALTSEDMWSPCLWFLAKAALAWMAVEAMRPEPVRQPVPDGELPVFPEHLLEEFYAALAAMPLNDLVRRPPPMEDLPPASGPRRRG